MTPQDALRLARELQAQGKRADARAVVAGLLAMDVRNADAIAALAALRADEGRTVAADALAREAGRLAKADAPGVPARAHDADVLERLARDCPRDDGAVEAVALHAAWHAAAPADGAARDALYELLCIRAASFSAGGRGDEALADWARARALDPGRIDGYWNECVWRLRRGDYLDGFRLYERRLARHGNAGGELGGRPRWSGDAPIAGRRLYVHAEQGIGDTLMFARFLPRVAALGARVVASVQPPLEQLLARSLPGVDVCPQHEVMVLPQFDAHCALPSLPHALRVDLASVPAELPYLHPDPARVAAWAARLGRPGVPRIGLAWAGNPAYPLDRERSIPAAALGHLVHPGARWFALQREPRAADAEAIRALGMEHPAAALEDFEDYAALLANLDLVLSVDSAAAHLAGALGRPLWALLSEDADWRWTRGVPRNPWYPHARLFWRAPGADWAGLLGEVRKALAARFAIDAVPVPAAGPLDPDAGVRLARERIAQGHFDDARALLHAVLRLAPRHEDASAALLELPDPGDRDATALLLRADAMVRVRRPADALQLLARATGAGADEAGLARRRGVACAALGRHAEALDHFARARSLAPGDTEVLRAECGLRLRIGDYGTGLRLYEARARWSGSQPPAPADVLPRWTGREPLEGRGLLVCHEQGFGDSIQFLRYLPVLRDRGALVRVMLPPPLAALARASFPWADVLAPDAPLPPGIDFQCPLPSLAFACGTTLETIPAQVPYLRVPPGRMADPRIAGASPRLRVGIAWSGNPAHPGDRERSIAAEAFLSALPVGPAYFSVNPGLQEACRAELLARGGVDLGAGFADFADTAAALAQFDLLVTVDTSVAHLAGALARETWILLPRVADWRWLLGREDSPWYPRAHLFRQTGDEGWTPVLARVRAALLARQGTNRI